MLIKHVSLPRANAIHCFIFAIIVIKSVTCGLYYKTIMIVSDDRKWWSLVMPQFGASLMVITDNTS
jgi:hypothetical protein